MVVASPLPPDLAPRPRDRALNVIATATLLAMLYFAREVLVPIALALILSLLLAPVVRWVRRLGLSHTASVIAAVLALSMACASVATVIASQLMRMAASLPEYENTIEHKLEAVDELTASRMNLFTSHAERLFTRRPEHREPGSLEEPAIANLSTPIPVEVHEVPDNPLQVLERLAGSVWVPVETAGIVLIVLVFVLLEQEALRDRFIRIAGGSDIRLTTLAINDAGERLSRFFVSQFGVNVGVGVMVWIGLSLMGLPHPLLWAGLAAVLRFVPYVGIWIAALCAALLAAAVDPGWALTFIVLGLFGMVELVASQLVEPQLYGHTTGLSPLSVVIAAIFWSWLWGPIGLIVSTPLTLCLLVAGRHIKALSLLDILLGDTQALTMPQRFYQRALSADAVEIIAGAREFLKQNSFANYCDLVLMPALHLARLDLEKGAITPDQQTTVRAAIVDVIAALAGGRRRIPRRHLRSSVLEQTNVGRLLRQQREQVAGRWQGPLSVPPGSVMLCVGLGSMADELAAELLVRILRDQKIDARHLSIDDLKVVPPPDTADAVSIVYLVSAFPSAERGGGDELSLEMKRRFPQACIVAVYLPGMLLQPDLDKADDASTAAAADKSAASLGHAVQICLDMRRKKSAA